MSLGRSIADDIKREFNGGNMLSRIIIVNVAVFVIVSLLSFVAVLSQSNAIIAFIQEWFYLPLKPMELLIKPWTIITHMFMHSGPLHILFNMLWLYWMGRIMREFIGDKHIFPAFFLGGLFGALLLFISAQVFPGLSNVGLALGASAGVMAIIVGTAVLVPDYTIFLLFLGPVKLKYLALFALILDLAGNSLGNPGGIIAHWGGAILGYVYISQLQTGNDWSGFINTPVNYLSNLFETLIRPKKGPKVYYKNEHKTTAKKTKKQDLSKNKQERIDEILDKISQSGYDALSAEEKDFLFRASKDES